MLKDEIVALLPDLRSLPAGDMTEIGEKARAPPSLPGGCRALGSLPKIYSL